MTDMPHEYLDNQQLTWAKWWFPEHPNDRKPMTMFVWGRSAWQTLLKSWTHVILPPVEYDDYGSVMPWREE